MAARMHSSDLTTNSLVSRAEHVSTSAPHWAVQRSLGRSALWSVNSSVTTPGLLHQVHRMGRVHSYKILPTVMLTGLISSDTAPHHSKYSASAPSWLNLKSTEAVPESLSQLTGARSIPHPASSHPLGRHSCEAPLDFPHPALPVHQAGFWFSNINYSIQQMQCIMPIIMIPSSFSQQLVIPGEQFESHLLSKTHST